MENFTQMIILSDASLSFYAIDFIILMGFMAALRILSGMLANVSLTELLAKQDNFAAGITMAGAVVAVAILMMGVVSGEAGDTYLNEVTLMVGYGVAAILLMWLTRKVFDHIILPKISIHDEIIKGNVAAGIVDAFNMVATAIIVRASLIWIDGSTLKGIIIVAILFVVSQIIMLMASVYRNIVFNSRYKEKDKSLQSELESGNIALAIRFSGHRLGVALAITATSGLVIFDGQLIVQSVIAWVVMAIAIFIAQTILSILLRHVLLPKVDVSDEVVEQKNVAVGAVEAAIYIGIGLTFVGLLG